MKRPCFILPFFASETTSFPISNFFEFPAISFSLFSLTSMRDTLLLGYKIYETNCQNFRRCHPTKASHLFFLALPASPLLFHNPWYCLRIGIYAADSDPFHFINPSNSNHTSPQCPILYLTRPSPRPSH